MVNANNFLRKNKYFLLIVVVLTGFISYMITITHSSLWYDEAVEYFYSKILIGEAPGVPGSFAAKNMYERICLTFQPPLYNILMYIWLLFFDSGDFTFRLAGILVTLIGAVGIYKCIDKLCGMKYAALGTVFYVFSSSVAYYALECAEYNLMLCCISWVFYFFVKCMKENSYGAFAGFFLFACLSVYSQYGAAFLVIALYLVLFANCLKDNKSLKILLTGTGIVALGAVLPLLYFFLLPQLEHQGTTTISHMPVFAINPIVDYIIGALITLWAGFKLHSADGLLGFIPLSIVCAAVLASIIALFKKNKEYIQFVVICVITYSLYFVAVACSFYGYNNWSGKLGCFNLSGAGGRYFLFLVPLFVITLTYGTSEFIKLFKHIKYRKVISVLAIMAATVFCFTEIYVLSLGWEKDDMRDVCQIWYDNQGFESVTLVYQSSAATFQFYLIHNDDYNEKYRNNIIMSDTLMQAAEHDAMIEELNEMGIFEHDELYYVCNAYEHWKNYEVFNEVYAEHGYIITVLYEKESLLLHIERV